jgi:hypothetical protein
LIENPTALEILAIIVKKCRENWVLTGKCLSKKEEVEEALLEEIKNTYNLDKDITWLNYDQKIFVQEAKRKLKKTQEAFDNYLEIFQKSGFIETKGEEIICQIQFDKLIENILSRDHEVTKVYDEIQKIFKGSPEDLLVFLQYSGLIIKEGNVLKSSLTAVRDVLLDDVLTFIEEKDALQIRYGIYDTSMVGADIFSSMRLSGDPYYVKLEYALRTLIKEKLLLPLSLGTDLRNWEFRSRIAEITRLLYKMRQRFYDHYSYRNSPKLTRSVKLEIVNRKFPRRSIQISNCVSSLRDQLKSSECWNEFAKSWNFMSSILVESLIKRGFEKIYDFQDRCFKKIFTHLADKQSSTRGLVITAGTGMGKTLSYLGPLVLYILFEKSEKKLAGTKAICIYPRIKLAENQIEGFIKAVYEINRRLNPDQHKISIGIDYTGTPYSRISFRNEPVNGHLFEGIDRLWIYDGSNDAYICPYARCPECGGDLHIKRNSNFSMKVPLVCAKCGTSIDFVLYCKDDIAEEPPDIFITTTETLTARLTSAKFQSIFGTEEYCVPKLIMIDEIHLHTSLRGSQVALLIRRLLKRLSVGLQHSRQSAGEPIILGLSATIGYPEEFFSELTGIPQHLIEIEGPREDEFEKSGVEYFIFIKPEIGENIAVLSNLIQTCMCVLHNIPQPTEFPKRNHKALGFVDSLDTVRRWKHDLEDAENNELYKLRDPELINSQLWIKNYFGVSSINCTNCSEMVDKTCIHFKEGECWWFLRFGKSQDEPLRLQYKTAGDGFVPLIYDLVVTTSAMEVGYDDPDIMCIIQYLSPMNIASFTQRKGRAGRDILNRPISVAVLSPYRTKDVYYYRNHHILIEPSFEKLPLNVDNKAIRKIHGFYAILDFLAFENRTEKIDFPARLSRNDAFKLEKALQHRKEFEKYLKGILGYKLEEKELEEIWSLFKELINRLWEFSESAEPSDILSEHLPENLFSSINLPTVDVYEHNVYDGNEEWQNNWRSGCSQYPKNSEKFLEMIRLGYCPQKYTLCALKRDCRPRLLEPSLDINLALTEAAIANVTFRWGGTAYWIPPFDYDNEQETALLLKQMNVKRNWLILNPKSGLTDFEVSGKLVPKTLKEMVPKIKNGVQNDLLVIRPDIIRVAKFLTPGKDFSHWIYCFDHDKIYAGTVHYTKDHNGVAHSYDTITERTTSYPFAFYNIKFEEKYLLKGTFKKTYTASTFEEGKFFGIFGDLIPEIYFGNKDTGEYLRVHKIITGSTCNITTRRGARIEKVFGYTDGNFDVGLGYYMDTDGVDIWIQPQTLELDQFIQENPEIFNTLKHNIFKFDILNINKQPGGYNSFAVDAFLKVYLTFITQNGLNSQTFMKQYNNLNERRELEKKFNQIINSFFTFNPKTKSEVSALFNNPQFVKDVIKKHAEILEETNKELILKYLMDIFLHSVKHALKSAFTVLGGFESERDIGAWTYLNFDYDFPLKHIYVFEHGMYGTGAFRSIYQKFMDNPRKLWNLVDEYLTSCPTADEEEFLKEVLKLDDKELNEIGSIVENIILAKNFYDRQKSIYELTDFFRKKYLMELKEDHVRALVRVFSKPLELENTKIENWKLFKELNIALYENLRKNFGRDLTVEELQQYCFIKLTTKDQDIQIPTWREFFNVLNGRVDSEYILFQRKIKHDLGYVKGLKRLLNATQISELERLHSLTEEEQFSEISKKFGLKDEADVKKILNVLFQEMDEIPLFRYYYYIGRNEQMPREIEEALKSSLAKRLLREEIEKRLLNTCIDACPSCLQTRCDIDFDLRSRLLLSRRLLKYIVSKIKQKSIINADTFPNIQDLKTNIIKSLEEKFEIYVQYSLRKSTEMAIIISDLLSHGIIKNGKKYYVYVNSSGYQKISLKNREVVYEICLRCRETRT